MLSDFNPRVVMNIAENIALNCRRKRGKTEHGGAEEGAEQLVEAAMLDWNIFLDAKKDHDKGAEAREAGGAKDGGDELQISGVVAAALEKVDLVIASDVICQTADALSLSRALKGLLKWPYGVGVVVAPFPENRFGELCSIN